MGLVANYLMNLGAVATGRQPRRPLLFSYYATHRCDLGCRYCCDGDGRRFRDEPIPELETRRAIELIGLLSRSADTLDVTGGEPMLRPDLEDLLAHARRCGMRTILNTKGRGLRGRREILRHVDVLVLSLDALEPARLAPLLGRPEAVAAELLDDMRAAIREAPATGTAVVLSAVATRGTLDGVRGVLAFAEAHGLGFHVSPEIRGTVVDPSLRGCDGYRELIDAVAERKRRGAAVLGVPHYLRGIRDFTDFRCHPLLMPVIRPDGRLYYPCLESKRAEVDILEAGSYETAIAMARRRLGGIPDCRSCCHLFCHMALSLLQRHPIAALREAQLWAGVARGARGETRTPPGETRIASSREGSQRGPI
jgi:MoaA/NifB/PqqE/SkfB family radical SAM enzyme